MPGMTARGTAMAAALALGLLPTLLAATAWAFTLADQTGRALTLAAPPARIISLVPSVTEILFAIGAQDRLVGVTDFCDFPPEARNKPRVGSMLAPSLETIVALRPDVLVATTAGNREETRKQLGRLRIPVFAVNPSSADEVLDLVERLGELTGRRAAAAALTGSLRTRMRSVAVRVAALPRPRVLYVLWPEPLIVPGRGALVSELIALAGGQSVTIAGGEGYPRYSVEAAVAQGPEVIILAQHGFQARPIAREQWERFTSLPAIKAGRLHSVDGSLFHRYGPRVVDGLEELARLFHPEAFDRASGRSDPAHGPEPVPPRSDVAGGKPR